MTVGQTKRIDCAESSASSVCTSLCLGSFECISLSSRYIAQCVTSVEHLSDVFRLGIKLQCKIQFILVTLQELQKNSVRKCSVTGAPQLALRKFNIGHMVAFFYLLRSWTIICTKLDNSNINIALDLC